MVLKTIDHQTCMTFFPIVFYFFTIKIVVVFKYRRAKEKGIKTVQIAEIKGRNLLMDFSVILHLNLRTLAFLKFNLHKKQTKETRYPSCSKDR
jgi:hypothetical protein